MLALIISTKIYPDNFDSLIIGTIENMRFLTELDLEGFTDNPSLYCLINADFEFVNLQKLQNGKKDMLYYSLHLSYQIFEKLN